MAFCLELITIVILSITIALYYLSKRAHCYWKRHNIPSIAPEFFFGHLKSILFLKEAPHTVFEKLYNDPLTKNQPAIGMYLFYKPALVIKDLGMIKRVLVKDFNYFADRFSAIHQSADILGHYNMFFVKNPEWKELRTSITPVFTSGKLKQMYPLVWEIGNNLDSHLRGLTCDTNANSTIVEIKDLSTIFTTDVIASVAFGIQARSFENPKGEFRTNGQKIFSITPKRTLEFGFIFFQPKLAKLLKSKMFSSENTEFLRSAIMSALEAREKCGVPRNDLIDILLALKKAGAKNNIVFNDDMLVAQAATFFNAGFETASSTISFGMYEIAQNTEVQNRLRDEIKRTLQENNGTITYEALTGMQYLHMVVQEVLRLYPPLPFLDRECLKVGGYSLEPQLDFNIPKGMPIFIPNYSIQRDPKYFENPEKFDPERFSPENKDKIDPSTYMPFGYGPRNCIGERLGLIQCKVGIINILKSHKVRPTKDTPSKLTLTTALLIKAKGGVNCELIRDQLL